MYSRILNIHKNNVLATISELTVSKIILEEMEIEAIKGLLGCHCKHSKNRKPSSETKWLFLLCIKYNNSPFSAISSISMMPLRVFYKLFLSRLLKPNFLSLCVRKPTIWVPTRSDITPVVQSQKMVRGWKFWL